MAKAKPRIGLYPGTFDPITKGHLEIVRDALGLVDRLVIGVAESAEKNPLFSIEERVELVKQEIVGLPNVAVMKFHTLTVRFAKRVGASIIIRGLRTTSDFEYELAVKSVNTKLDPTIKTLFLPASDKNQCISSSLVKNIAAHGGDLRHFVGPSVAKALRRGLKGKSGPT